MRTRIAVLLAGAAVVGIGAAPARAHAQNPTVDSRWLAYLGCWRSIEIGIESTVCLVPGAETAAVDLVTIDSGRVAAAEQIIAGQRLETARPDCTGWQDAQWSGVSDRLYLRSEETCAGWGTRTATGLIALTQEGQLLYIQGSTIGGKTGLRVQRYREAAAELNLPSEVQDALNALDTDLTATARARAAAAAPLAIEDLAEASRELDVEVVEAWLVARGGAFQLDAQRLIALAAAGVPARITDLMIALSNPAVFVVDASAGEARRVSTSVNPGPVPPVYPVSELYGACGIPYVFLPLSSPYCDGYAFRYPYPYGWYPVSIIYTGGVSGGGSGGNSRSHGRVVNGRGYQEGTSTSSDVVRTGQPRSTSSGAMPAPSASTTSGEQRTAKPRP
ncbi:MAG: hypothetical protein ACM358_10255 [Gemmatimonadota bacterium]